MRLLNKSTLFHTIWLLPVLIFSGFFFYEIILWQIDASTDESIVKEKNQIIKFFDPDRVKGQQAIYYGEGNVIIHENENASDTTDYFSDTENYDSTDKEMIPYRMLMSSFSKKGKHFQMTITRSVIESDELGEGIAQALFLLFGLMMIGLLTVNRILSRRLWKPFNESLSKLNALSFADMKPDTFAKSSIKEFSELNTALNRMTVKMLSDFNNQKQFIENAAHEMQTPLAVLKAKTDMLIQSKNVSGQDFLLIENIEQSINKLSRLNKTLLLLSKIENRQFEDASDVELPALIDRIILNLGDHILSRELAFVKNYSDMRLRQLNPLLAEILFTNLIQNAIRYNIHGGSVKIFLGENYCEISNTGTPLEGDTSGLFRRFTKFNSSHESLGLGLSIAHQICSYYNWQINYRYENEMHFFRIVF